MYNLATFSIPGRPDVMGDPVLALSGCTGEFEGLHVQGKALMDEVMQGLPMILTYHWDPKFDPE
jgi:hypothetical protein